MFSCLVLFAGILVIQNANQGMLSNESKAENIASSIGRTAEPSPNAKSDQPQASNLIQPQVDPQVLVPTATDPSLQWNVTSDLLGTIDKSLQQVESQLEGTGAVASLLRREKMAIETGGPAKQCIVHVWTTGNGTSPTLGDFIDINVCLPDIDASNPEVISVVREVRVVSTKDDSPESTLNRLVPIELELTQAEMDRIRSYEPRGSFTYSRSTTSQ